MFFELTYISINHKDYDYSLPLHETGLVYLSDFSSGAQWTLRGWKAHSRDQETLESRRKHVLDQLKESIQTGNEVPEVRSYIHNVVEIFENLRNDPDSVVQKHFQNKQFIFVVGHMRTGGTYLLKNLMKTRGLDLENYNLGFIHDECPSDYFLSGWPARDARRGLYFQLAQLIHWYKEEFSGDTLFKKRVSFGHALPAIDEIFGDKVKYIVTVRHPAPAGKSFAEMVDIPLFDDDYNHESWEEIVTNGLDIEQQRWRQLNGFQQFLYYWVVYYLNIAETSHLKEQIIPLEFGSEYEDFVEEFAGENKNVDIESFDPKKRYSNSEIPHEEEINKCIKMVSRRWDECGLEFPDLST